MDGMKWRKSSRSGTNGENCVELTAVNGGVAVRDSKDPYGPILTFRRNEFREFIATTKAS
jgi:hypothetical protein